MANRSWNKYYLLLLNTLLLLIMGMKVNRIVFIVDSFISDSPERSFGHLWENQIKHKLENRDYCSSRIHSTSQFHSSGSICFYSFSFATNINSICNNNNVRRRPQIAPIHLLLFNRSIVDRYWQHMGGASGKLKNIVCTINIVNACMHVCIYHWPASLCTGIYGGVYDECMSTRIFM